MMWWPTPDQVAAAMRIAGEDPTRSPTCPIWVADLDDEFVCAYCEDGYEDHTEAAQKRGEKVTK